MRGNAAINFDRNKKNGKYECLKYRLCYAIL
jgi:hypothetical protein